MGTGGSKLQCRCGQSPAVQPQPYETSFLLLDVRNQQLELQRQICNTLEFTKDVEKQMTDEDWMLQIDTATADEVEFALNRLPYPCLRLIADNLSTDDLLSLCQTSPENCRIFGSGVFWIGRSSASATDYSIGPAYECLNAALERKLCLPVESLNGTYLPSLEDAESYSGRVVYLHDLNCRVGGVVGGDVVGGGVGGSGGGRLCIHDVVQCVPRGTYLVSLRAKLGPHWRLKGVTEVLLIPDPSCLGAGPLRARIPERRWCDLAFRHGYEHWFSVSLGRLCLPQSCSVQVQIVNTKVSKSQLKEGVYLDHIELTPLHCPLAQFTGYPRTAVRKRQRRRTGASACQLL